MPPTLPFRNRVTSAAELIRQLCGRGIALNVDGSRLFVSPRSSLTDADRLLICEHKPELLRLLGAVVQPAPEVTQHRETIPAECFSTTVESWDERGIANLVAVARKAGLRLECDCTALMIDGPSSPTELRRLLREHAAGIAILLQRP